MNNLNNGIIVKNDRKVSVNVSEEIIQMLEGNEVLSLIEMDVVTE